MLLCLEQCIRLCQGRSLVTPMLSSQVAPSALDIKPAFIKMIINIIIMYTYILETTLFEGATCLSVQRM